MFNIQNKNNIYFMNTVNTISDKYEQQSSIVSPQNILTTGLFSINLLLSKIHSTYLNYHTQEESTILSQIYTFNLIVESLTKQYYFNKIF